MEEIIILQCPFCYRIRIYGEWEKPEGDILSSLDEHKEEIRYDHRMWCEKCRTAQAS